MMPENSPRFDIEAVRELAGGKTFARGEDYHRNGQVALLSVEPARVLARVAGTEDYRTELTGHGAQVDGTCTCPAFEDRGFCKHMVAVALAANADSTQGEAAQDNVLARIRQHLEAKDVGALVDMIMGLVERDAKLFRKLELAAAAATLDDKAAEARLRRMIDSAIGRTKTIGYYEVRDWAAGVAEALDAVADLVPAGRPELALTLADRTLGKVEQALDRIDDSDGYCGALLHRAREIHLAAARLAPPEPLELARELFARQTGGGYGTFDGAVVLYADVLGEMGLAEFRRLASEAWQKLPSRSGTARQEVRFSVEHQALRDILDFFAERDGDVDARIALRSKDLTSPWHYLELAQFCLSQGRKEEALRRAEDGLWMFEDRDPDEPLLLFAVGLLTKAGRQADAEARLWQAFEKAPSLAVFAALRKLGGPAARDRVLAMLEAELDRQTATNWYFPADMLVGILIGEQMFDRAWAIVRAHNASPSQKERLARKSEATHPGDALAVYAARVDELAALGGDPSYDQAMQLVARIARLQDAATQAAYVAALKLRYARKRNFIRRLG